MGGGGKSGGGGGERPEAVPEPTAGMTLRELLELVDPNRAADQVH